LDFFVKVFFQLVEIYSSPFSFSLSTI